MNIEKMAGALATPKSSLSAEQLDAERKRLIQSDKTSAAAVEKKSLQPEELLDEIKALTEDGLYSVRFENDNDRLIVKVVDSRSNEVIRQIPSEELLELSNHLSELEGNLVDILG